MLRATVQALLTSLPPSSEHGLPLAIVLVVVPLQRQTAT